MVKYGKGTVHDRESKRFNDEQTGASIIQLTSHPSINHNLYFLTSSFTPDQKHVIFASYRSGKPNYFRLRYPDGQIKQLTDGDGIIGYSGVISKDGKRLFYTQAEEIKVIDIFSLEEEVIARVEGVSFGECNLNTDEEYLVTAMKKDGKSHLFVVDVDKRKGKIILESPQPIIHPQFHPLDPDLIAYSKDPAPRMWTIYRDGTEDRLLYNHGNDEFIVHETFLGDGKEMIVSHWPKALKRISLASLEMKTIAEFNAWHISSNKKGTKVLCDTVHPDIGLRLVDVKTGRHEPICYPNSSCQGTQWKKSSYALADDWQDADKENPLEMEVGSASKPPQVDHSPGFNPLDTVYGPQQTHPHPGFSPDESMVVFTSDVSGHPQVYVAEIPEKLRR